MVPLLFAACSYVVRGSFTSFTLDKFRNIKFDTHGNVKFITDKYATHAGSIAAFNIINSLR